MPGIIRRSRKKKVRKAIVEAVVLHDRDDSAHRPSGLIQKSAIMRLAELNASRVAIPVDPNVLYRVYKDTSQRVPLRLQSLNSHAAFIFVCSKERNVVVWVGSKCNSNDHQLATELALAVYNIDLRYGNATDKCIRVTKEGSENSSDLQFIAQKLWTDECVYRSKQASSERKAVIANNDVTLGYFEKMSDKLAYTIRPHKTGKVNKDGSVDKLFFIVIKPKTIVTVRVGVQWYMWLTKDISSDAVISAKKILLRHMSNVSKDSTGYDSLSQVNVASNLQVIIQGQERHMFRNYFKKLTDFEPDGIYINRSASSDATHTMRPAACDIVDGESGIDGIDDYGDDGDDDEDEDGSVDAYDMIDDLQFDEYDSMTGIESFAAGHMNPTSAGKAFIVADMLVLRDKQNVTPKKRTELLLTAVSTPKALIGWQIEIDEGKYRGIHVVTGVRKNFMRKSYYRLSSMASVDVWIRIKRSHKRGIVVRPLRKVFSM